MQPVQGKWSLETTGSMLSYGPLPSQALRRWMETSTHFGWIPLRISGKQLGFIQLETVQHLPRCQPCQASQDLHTITAEYGSRHNPTKDVKGIAIRAMVLLYLERHSLTKMTCFMNLYHWNRGQVISYHFNLFFNILFGDEFFKVHITSLQDDSY